eukprot:1176368-Prorocentrum_minimum.AAC.2
MKTARNVTRFEIPYQIWENPENPSQWSSPDFRGSVQTQGNADEIGCLRGFASIEYRFYRLVDASNGSIYKASNGSVLLSMFIHIGTLVNDSPGQSGGVECTLAVVGTGGPVKRSNIIH